MKIVLMGYMGSGKSLIGNCLAEQLDLECLDLDTFVEEKEGMSLSQLVAQKGEVYFRKKETQYLAACLKMPKNIILSLGGGTPCFSGNLALIAQTPQVQVVYLKTSIPVLVARLFEERKKRPLIAHLETKDALIEFIGKHLFERAPFYSQATHTVVTDHQTAQQIAAAIAKLL